MTRTMKIRFLKLKNWLLAALGGLLGMNFSCSRSAPPVCEYGAPVASYRVKGVVCDENGNPIEGINVNTEYRTTKTDKDGGYDITMRSYPGIESFDVEFSDKNGNQDGSYADTTITVSFKDATFSGGDGRWKVGTATVVQDVTLHPSGK